MTKRILLLAMLLTLSTRTGNASGNYLDLYPDASIINFEVGLMGLFPMTETGDNINSSAAGGGLIVTRKYKNSQIVYGVDLQLGTSTTDGHQGWGYNALGKKYEINTMWMFGNGLANIKYQFELDNFRPYVEAVAGIRMFFNMTESDYSYNNSESDDSDRKIEYFDLTWAAGVGCGLIYRFGIGFFFNLSTRYMFGGDVDFISEFEVNESGKYSYKKEKSITDVLIVRIGFGVPIL